MTTQVKPPPPAIAPVPPPAIVRETRKFTVAEYFRMAEAGILREKERVELIDGEVLIMPPMGHYHIGGVARYARVFISRAANRYTVLIQSTIRLGAHFAPEPDLVLVKYREDDYYFAHAGPEDVLLIIEVADSSLAHDRAVKARRYGQAGIPETWILNLPEDCLERFTEPGPEGYARHHILRRGDTVRLAALPDLELAVAELLPPVNAATE